MGAHHSPGPVWDDLYETASVQEGLFTTHQGSEAGYSSQLLRHHLRNGRVRRVRRGIYRLVHFPPAEHEELVTLWLWSGHTGVFSHETALALHGLSDLLPATAHLTLPLSWKQRRFRLPEGVILHHADIDDNARTWFGAIPLTTPARTLEDCAIAALSPEFLQQASKEALRRGLVVPEDLPNVRKALAPFGGIEQ